MLGSCISVTIRAIFSKCFEIKMVLFDRTSWCFNPLSSCRCPSVCRCVSVPPPDFQHKITVQASPCHDRRRSVLGSGSSPPGSPPLLTRLRAIQRKPRPLPSLRSDVGSTLLVGPLEHGDIARGLTGRTKWLDRRPASVPSLWAWSTQDSACRRQLIVPLFHCCITECMKGAAFVDV